MPNYLSDSLEEMARNYGTDYQTAAQVQDALSKDEYQALHHEKNFKRYEKEKEHALKRQEEKKKRLETIRNHLPYVKNVINKAQDNPYVLKKYENTFMDETLEKLEIERWMKNNNATHNNAEFKKYNLHRTIYAYYVDSGEQLAEWFATGAAGPGTVTFMGKDYTAA